MDVMTRIKKSGHCSLAVLLAASVLIAYLGAAPVSARGTATPTFSVSPSSAAQGGVTTISGSGWAPKDVITFTLSGVTAALATIQADANGVLPSTRVTIPYSVRPGAYLLTATGTATSLTAVTTLSITEVRATLKVTPGSAPQGAAVSISGATWAPNEQINLAISGVSAPFSTLRADGRGNLAPVAVQLPFTTTIGEQTISATGVTSGRSAAAPIVITPVTATLAATPTATNPGGVVTIWGASFVPSETVTVTIEGVVTPLATISTTPAGAIPQTGIAIPYGLPLGTAALRVTGSLSKRTANTALSVGGLSPSIHVSPTTSAPSRTVVVTGSGFGQQEQVTLALNGEAVVTAPPLITTTNGAFSASVTLPPSLLAGTDTLSAIGASSRVNALTALSGVLPMATALYFAGASTLPGERDSLALLNTNAQPAHVALTFYYQGHSTRATVLDVAAHSRATADLTALAGAGRVFGLELTADRGVTAQLHQERTGQDDGDLLGVPGPRTRWYLAEGYTGLTFHETLALVNPNTRASTVRLRLLPAGGRPARLVSESVGPRSALLVDVNRLMPNQPLSIIADASRPIVLARTLTFSKGRGTTGYGLTDKVGANAAASSWLFAEGTTTTRFQTFLTILNPNTAGALVTVSFYGESGGALGSHTVYVAGLSRATIRLNDDVRASAIASVVTSNLPVVVERPVYFGSPNDSNVAGSDVFGRNGVGITWSFPGGDTDGRDEYLLIYNPSARTATIAATFYGSDGAVKVAQLYIPPEVRYTLNVNQLEPRLTAQHGVTLRSTNGVGVVAEQTIFAPNYSALSSTQGAAS